MHSLRIIRCVTREKELFQTRVRCRAEHLTFALNSSFSPLVYYYRVEFTALETDDLLQRWESKVFISTFA